MGTLTIRNVDEVTHSRLRERAARHGRSVEAEVREILSDATDAPESNFLVALHAAITADGAGGVDLEIPFRRGRPRPVDFS